LEKRTIIFIDECAASIIFADRDKYFCRLSPRLIESVRLHFTV
jgi:hypothetical protein